MTTIPTFNAIVFTFSTFIRRTLRSRGVQDSDLDDATQGVLLAVHAGLQTFAPTATVGDPVRGWLHEICRRQAANIRRWRRTRGEVLSEPDDFREQPAAGPAADVAMVDGQRARFVARLLERVPSRRRTIVERYDLGGEEMRDIATALGLPVNTAWNLRRLALRDMRTLVKNRCLPLDA